MVRSILSSRLILGDRPQLIDPSLLKFNVACLVHQSLSSRAPAFVANDIDLVSHSHHRCFDRLPTGQ